MEININGQDIKVDFSHLPADITLNRYIRQYAGLSGTKSMCLEGGCGICNCVVKRWNPQTGVGRVCTVNSCLVLLATCQGWHITTIEGLGGKSKGYHPIQSQLAKFNGSQCGFCSPGMVMNMFGLLCSTEGNVSSLQIENSFGGNICRCTGYRPIMDAMKTFANDNSDRVLCPDIEDLGGRCLKTIACNKVSIDCKNGAKWFYPRKLNDLHDLLKNLEDQEYILIAGNTAHGVYRRNLENKLFVDINGIPELHEYEIGRSHLKLGANLSLTEVMDVFKEAAKVPGFKYCQELLHHFDLIGSIPVRNMGTLAGNLATKNAHPEFPSDVFTTLEALNATLLITENGVQRTVHLNEFMTLNLKGKVITSISLASYLDECFTFRSFRIMPRSQNAFAYVNAGFLLEIAHGEIKSARLCFGGIDPTFIHATKTENNLIGKDSTTNETLKTALVCLENELEPISTVYRRKLACGLFYKFILSLVKKCHVSDFFRSGGDLLKRPVSSGTQVVNPSRTTLKPIGYLDTLLKCAGEAKYINDLPVHSDHVWCAFVHATKVGADIINIDARPALDLPGVIAFYSAKDIPHKNSFVSPKFITIDTDEEIFCSKRVAYHNQPVGVIVANTFDLANFAATKVRMTYRQTSDPVYPTFEEVLELKPPGRTEDALKSPIQDVRITEPVYRSASGSLKLGQQYHFQLEPHTTIAVPVENKLQVFCATQWMDLTQYVIAKALGMNMHDVQLRVQRLGGAFGSKITRGNIAACAAALAAVKLNKPVRFIQSLESMMGSLGKRWACYSEYDFQVASSGKILRLENLFYEDAGSTSNENAIDILFAPIFISFYELQDKLILNGKFVYSDAPSNTWCRSPGSLEAVAMIETIMEHVAFEAGLDPIDARLINIPSDNKIRGIIDTFLKTNEYIQRKRQIDVFNAANRWRKKGLGYAHMKYLMVPFGPYAATVAIYHGDGSVVVSHGGIEIGQGLNTKVVQVAAHSLGIPVNMVQIDASSTLNGANSCFTGASITSESVCFAVSKACETLMKRLQPIKDSLDNPTWSSLIDKASDRGVHLIATDEYSSSIDPYDVYGMALTEIEIDVLTGNHLIHRVDILEEIGESLNPIVDIGQVEGAFVMGLGYFLTEQIVHDKKTGELLTNGSSKYKVPGWKDIPIDFRIELIQNNPNPTGFMRSKSAGEPPICLAVSALFATQQAIQSARNDAGLPQKWITLGAPTTPEDIVLNSGSEITQFKLH